jgi:hypothetical protein
MLFHEIVFWAACKTEKLELVKQLYEERFGLGASIAALLLPIPTTIATKSRYR